jgi:hypothetical protein
MSAEAIFGMSDLKQIYRTAGDVTNSMKRGNPTSIFYLRVARTVVSKKTRMGKYYPGKLMS